MTSIAMMITWAQADPGFYPIGSTRHDINIMGGGAPWWMDSEISPIKAVCLSLSLALSLSLSPPPSFHSQNHVIICICNVT
jgi:hypothetical protein